MNHTTIRPLTKTRFGAGLQCHKRLYLESYSPKLADPLDAAQKALFETGTAIGRLAQERFPGGHLISDPPFRHAQAVAATQRTLGDGSVQAVYEGAFTFDDVRIRVDILSRADGGSFDLVEVKSSTSVKAEHVPDVAIQLYVLQGCGIRVRDVFLMHIDNNYVYEGGPYDLGRLFWLESTTREAREFVRSSVREALAEMRGVLRRHGAPEVEIGRQCTSPYRCAFHGYCRQGGPEHHIEQIPWAKAPLLESLSRAGIRDIRDIPAGFQGLSVVQQRVRDSVVTGQPWRNPEIGRVLRRAAQPLHFLDFETFNPALPLYPGTRPYQVIPFEWSLHVRDSAGNLRHHLFLHDGDGDPREPFSASLLEHMGPEGSIVVYSGYERRILTQLASELPQFSDRLPPLCDRMLDLLQVLREFYYHPQFHGSYSMKSVLPVLASDLGYDDLEIQDGTQASAAFAKMILDETPHWQRQRLREALHAYCGRDTEAMVRVFDALG